MKTTKNNKQKLFIITLVTIYVTIFFIMLFISINHYYKRKPKAPHANTINNVTATYNGVSKKITLPYQTKKLKPQQELTINFKINSANQHFIYVKTVYAPLKVYANNILIYQYGSVGSQPSYMIDPPTKVKIIELPHSKKNVHIKIKYYQPQLRETLIIHPILHGDYKDILNSLFFKMGFIFSLALVNVIIGILMIIIGFIISFIEKKSVSLMWLGLFSLLTGIFSLGECNLTELYINNESLLYLLDFCAFFILPIPLIQACTSIVDFKNVKILRIIQINQAVLATLALFGQILTICPLYKSLYLFIFLSPINLIYLTFSIIREHINGNTQSKHFILPITIVALSAIFEAINYKYRFVPILSACFMVGVTLFVILIGINCIFYIRQLITLKSEHNKLEYDLYLMQKQIDAQEKRNEMVQQNAAIIKSQRHDLRHQLAVIRQYNIDGEKDKITEYLDSLITSIPNEQSMTYCENQAVNAILIYYLATIKDAKISVKLSIPNDLSNIIDSDLCIIIGNLIENAIEACNRMDNSQKKFIKLTSHIQYDTLTITLDNSFNGSYRKEKDVFISSKRNEPGIGIESIKNVVKKYSGDCRFEIKNDVFMASVYIKI